MSKKLVSLVHKLAIHSMILMMILTSVLSFLLVVPLVRAGSTYYVDDDGNLGGDGSYGDPWKTIQQGVDNLSAGDTLYIRHGEYTDKVNINGLHGTSSNWITISNYNDEQVTLNGNGLSWSWYIGMFHMTSCSYIIVNGLYVRNCTNAQGVCISTRQGHNITIQNCHTSYSYMSGIWCGNTNGYASSGGAGTRDLIIDNCWVQYARYLVSPGSQESISLFNCTHFEISNTLVDDTNPYIGICSKGFGSNASIHDNVIESGDFDIYIGGGGHECPYTCGNFSIYNNYCSGENGIGIGFECGGGNYIHDVYVYNNVFTNSNCGLKYTDVDDDCPDTSGDYSVTIDRIYFFNNVFDCTGHCMRFNAVPTGDGALYFTNTTIINNVFDGSEAIVIAGQQIGHEDEFTLSHNVYVSTSSDLYGANSINTSDAGFTGFYNLTSSSVCRDSGDNNLIPSFGIDFWGNTRIYNTTVDRGISEYGSSPAEGETAPSQTSPNPSQGDNDVTLSLANRSSHFSIAVSDPNGDDMDITWRTNESGTWQNMGTNTTVYNGTYYCNNVSWVDENNSKYYWSVNVTDDTEWSNATYYFYTHVPAVNYSYCSFGVTANDYNDQSPLKGNIQLINATPTCGDGNLTNILVRVRANDSGHSGYIELKSAIYNVTGSQCSNLTLYAVSEELNFDMTTTWSWANLTFDPPIAITNNTEYSIGVWANDSSSNDARCGYETIGGTRWLVETDYDYADGFPTYLPSGSWTQNSTSYVFAIYGLYDTSEGQGGSTVYPPTNFYANNYNNSVINLSWTKGANADKTSIVRKKNSYPSNHGDGTEVYNNTGISFDDTGLDLGTHYYYKAWSWNNSLNFSDSTAIDNAYTSPGNPSSLVNGTVTANSTILSWNNGVNFSNAVIRYKTGSYPSSPTDGASGYNGSLDTYNITGLASNTTYFYRIWNWVNPYSEGYDELNVTTDSAEINITTNATNNIQETSARIHGCLINDDGQDLTIGFEFGETTSYGQNITNFTKNESIFRPNANGTYMQIDPEHFPLGDYTAVDDVVRDNTSTMLTTDYSVAYRTDTYSIPDHTTESGAINFITIYVWTKTWAYPPGGWVKGTLLVDSTLYSGTAVRVSPTGGWTIHDYTWSLNPSTSTYWTWDDIDNLEVGLSMKASGGNDGVTQVYLVVNYTESIPSVPHEFYADMTGLTSGRAYHTRAYANVTGDFVYGDDEGFITLPYSPSGLSAVLYNSTVINLTWTKGNGANKTMIRRKVGSYPSSKTDGTLVYNDTGISYNNTGLSLDNSYYYRAWSFATWGGYSSFSSGYSSDYVYTALDPPYNVTGTYYIGGILNITWNRGNYTDTDVVVRKLSSYPTSHTDGTEIDNTSNNTGGLYYYTDIYDGNTYYYCVFSYNSTENLYSNPVQVPSFGGLGLNCFNESTPSQAINFDILISNQNATITFYAEDISNTYWLNVGDIPFGADTVFYVSNDSYKSRTYYYDISLSETYNLTFYLPPKETLSPNETGAGTLRAFSNVISVTNPAVNATIPLSYDLESIIEVSIYNLLYNEKIKTDSKTVSNPAVNVTIPLTYTLEDVISVEVYDIIYLQQFRTDSQSVSNPAVNVSIPLTKTVDEVLGVYVWNSTLYGGWRIVPNDMYSLYSTNCTVNNTVLDDNSTAVKIEYYYLKENYGQWSDVPTDMYDASSTQVEIDSDAMTSNTSMVRVQYYYLEESYGQWVTVPEDMYTATTTQVEIDSDVLTSNTSMAKAEYYYMDYENTTVETKLYVIKVINEYDYPIQNASITIKRYITSTDGFATISKLKADGNGQAEVYLIPHVLYKVFISADSYHDLEISEWIPDEEFYGIYHPKYFRLLFIKDESPYDTNVFYGLTWSIEPINQYHTTSFWWYFNISSSSADLEYFHASAYYWNNTNVSWDLINDSNVTTQPSGGSISFHISNNTGRYSFVAFFKRENFSLWHFGGEDGCRVHYIYAENISMMVADIPDLAYLIITIIFTLLVMGFLVKFGAGVNAGIPGLCVMGGMFALKPDMAFGHPAISVWILFLVTAIAYIIVMFISRRT